MFSFISGLVGAQIFFSAKKLELPFEVEVTLGSPSLPPKFELLAVKTRIVLEKLRFRSLIVWLSCVEAEIRVTLNGSSINSR